MTIADRPQVAEQPLEHEIDPAVQRALTDHAGLWVALTRSEIIAAGDDARTVLEQAHAAGVEDPILFRVPEDSDTAYFF